MKTEQLAALFDAHHQDLYRMGLRMLNRPEDAEDLLQETFLKAWRASKRMPTDADGAKAWLFRILINSCRDRYRRKGARKTTAQADFSQVPTAQDEEHAHLAKHTVHQALAALPAKRRAVVILHELEGLPPPEIGKLLNMQAVTVRWHLSKGRKAMNTWIREKEVSGGSRPTPKLT